MRPATMPACSWSLPSVGDTLCDGLLLLVELHRQRAVAQQPGEVAWLRPCVKVPEICTSRPVMPGLIVGADCTTPSSSIATCLLTYGPATLSTKSFVLNVDLGDVRRRVGVVLARRGRDVAAGQHRGAEQVAGVRVTGVGIASGEDHGRARDVRGGRREHVLARLARLRRSRSSARSSRRVAVGVPRRRGRRSWSRSAVVACAGRTAAIGVGRRPCARRRRVPVIVVDGRGAVAAGAVVVAPGAVVVVAPGAVVVVVAARAACSTGASAEHRPEAQLGGLADELLGLRRGPSRRAGRRRSCCPGAAPRARRCRGRRRGCG